MLNVNAMRMSVLAASGLAAALSCALAADDRPGARPGDDALTCEQLYAQGSAEAQRDEQERRKREEQRRAEGQGMAALVAGALLAGGLGGTAQAANKAAFGLADKTMAEAGAAPPTNPRLEHLKRLWTAKRCVQPGMSAPAANSRSGDDAMDCAQIATELSPYVQQMKPNIAALGQTQQQLYERARQKSDERRTEHEALTPYATAAALDPTGIAKRGYVEAVKQQAAKERREDEAEMKSPLAQQAKTQTAQLAAQGQQMQSDERLQTLLALAQRKGCTQSK